MYEGLIPECQLKSLVETWLKEDCPNFDIAGSIVHGQPVTAQILGKSPGILCGRPFVQQIFDTLGCQISWRVEEGAAFQPVTVIAELEGEARNLLLGERTALNLLARASAIATKYSSVESGFKGRLAGTRKTTPGFRLVEKYAMLVAGCDPHRFDLSTMIMLKDNHIDIVGSISQAVSRTKGLVSFGQKIEVECRSLEDALEALTAGADIVMLDNVGPEKSAAWSLLVKEKFPNAMIEVSGGITEETIQSFISQANSIDVISMGSLTQDMQHIDYSLSILKKP